MDLTFFVALVVGVYVGWMAKKVVEQVKPQVQLLKDLWATMPWKSAGKEGCDGSKIVETEAIVVGTHGDGKARDDGRGSIDKKGR